MSMHPDPERLAAVAIGEPVPPQLEAHLAECPQCAAELAKLRRLTGDLGSLSAVEWVDPPESVWASIEPELLAADASAIAPPTRRATEPATDPPRAPGWQRWLALGVAAAVGVVAGAIGGRAWWPAPTTQLVVVATTNLDTLDDQRRLGEASLLRTGGGVELSVRTEVLDPGPGFLEVWLLNIDGERMVSLGILADNSTGLFPVEQELLDAGYRIVDISREGLDGLPTHSGDSLARGELPV